MLLKEVESVVTACEALNNNEALFIPGEVVVARSNTGKLRIGSWYGGWYRKPDVLADVREWLTGVTDPRVTGYYAHNLRRQLADLPKPVAGRVTRSGFEVAR